ncbi:hypothetical protein ACFVFJ_48595 [Streptomyces sp. NPDC057717]|uniref:hypothetical protein n=1 Tax=Streptomyces sp. NPDC057717 TaxID=3346224 RepID=UPI00367F6AA5
MFSVTEPGSGTTRDRPLVELTAIAADSGKRLWTTTVEQSEGMEQTEPDRIVQRLLPRGRRSRA